MSKEYVSRLDLDYKVRVSFVGEFAEYCALGGGFIYRQPKESFLARYRPCEASDFGMRPMTFELEGGDSYDGFTDGRRWNGWEQPWVTKAVLESFLADHEDFFVSAAESENGFFTLVDDNGLDEEIILKPFKGLYHLDFGWCFEESKEAVE